MAGLLQKGVVPAYRDRAEKPDDIKNIPEMTGRLASQAIGGIKQIQPAADIMEDLMTELVGALKTDHMEIKAVTAQVMANATAGKL